jgi:hypothetical protein
LSRNLRLNVRKTDQCVQTDEKCLLHVDGGDQSLSSWLQNKLEKDFKPMSRFDDDNITTHTGGLVARSSQQTIKTVKIRRQRPMSCYSSELS